jgi:hypothetical protein
MRLQIRAPRAFLVHGEEEVMPQFATRLGDTRAEVPASGQVYEL